ncbi:methyl-accepting chemotaxis protein [Paraburkholderia sp.]|uniref:HAMP domain-containing protein n=1 Tax=Paraburkholderia sp. TaxID=1926495 RepID=UPI0023A0A4D4|nr:methyl-accepting chemotaxis protein [Paraburkholderia sp.]MDE1180581.1 methyl-accepting chemotaxis protein [Paraburkholderia sp.]
MRTGDLTQRLQLNRNDEIGALENGFNRMTDGLAMLVGQVQKSAHPGDHLCHRIEQMVKEIQSAVSASVMGMDKFAEEVRRGILEVQHVGGHLTQIIQQVQALAPRFRSVNEGMQAEATGAEQISQALSQLSEAAQQTVESLRQSDPGDRRPDARGEQSADRRVALQRC